MLVAPSWCQWLVGVDAKEVPQTRGNNAVLCAQAEDPDAERFQMSVTALRADRRPTYPERPAESL